MNLPQPGDYIDIHNHDAEPAEGVFTVDNITAGGEKMPADTPRLTYSIGIHPWHLTAEDFPHQLRQVEEYSNHTNVMALGEAGFDRIKGPGMELQREAFIKQVSLSEKSGKPLYIHCVRAWDELLHARKELKPRMPWIVHGFRGRRELAAQLISAGMYLSFWFSYVKKPEAGVLLRSLPAVRIFLETDGGNTSIAEIYRNAAGHLGITEEQLKMQIYSNFFSLISH